MRITYATYKAIDYACKHFHYAKATPVSPLGYNIYNDDGEWCGVICYGFGSCQNIGKPYGLPMGGVVELTRVALNGKQSATSQAVALSIRQLHKDCPGVRLIVSYADVDQNHLGTIYQATNWVYVGVFAAKSSAFIIHGKKRHMRSIHSFIINDNGEKKHCPQTLEAVRRYIDPNATIFYSKGKRKYLFPLDKKMRMQIEPLRKPFPKSDENWMKIDRTIFHKKNEHTQEQ